MATLSPYRTLPAEKRVALITHAIKSSREVKALSAQRLIEARKGGFRAVTMMTWPADRLAKEIVRAHAETANDELDLLQLLYVELDPAIQITFLDAAGVRHEKGLMTEELELPYADAPAVERATAEVKRQIDGLESAVGRRTDALIGDVKLGLVSGGAGAASFVLLVPSSAGDMHGELLEHPPLLVSLHRPWSRLPHPSDCVGRGEPLGDPVGSGHRPRPAHAALAVHEHLRAVRKCLHELREHPAGVRAAGVAGAPRGDAPRPETNLLI